MDELIQKMYDEVDKISEEGPIDRHCCQDICSEYIRKAFDG